MSRQSYPAMCCARGRHVVIGRSSTSPQSYDITGADLTPALS
jgi:hypothetical protein